MDVSGRRARRTFNFGLVGQLGGFRASPVFASAFGASSGHGAILGEIELRLSELDFQDRVSRRLNRSLTEDTELGSTKCPSRA